MRIDFENIAEGKRLYVTLTDAISDVWSNHAEFCGSALDECDHEAVAAALDELRKLVANYLAIVDPAALVALSGR